MFSLLRFKHHWRSYQARVLAQLHLHQADRKIHIIAPPGAGKTVLGLEIIQRHRKQTLVLAPSLTIREQWIVRLKEDFIQQGSLPEGLISRDLYRPASITLVTYQALHQFLKKEKSDKLYWIEMLVVDECHHLRREWWRSLDQLYQQVSPFLLALTATPPLDVSSTEWRRYHSFCGEIDEEISIPELVSSGDLCPHQDFIYPVLPEPEVLQRSQAFTQAKAELYQLLREQRFLAQYLQAHPWLSAPEAHYEEIFSEPAYFTSLLVVLRHLGSEPPASALGVLHGEVTVAPLLDDEWLAIFLQKALRDDAYLQQGEAANYLRPIHRHLTAMGAWDKGQLHLLEPPDLGKKIRHATAKIQAVREIAAHEWQQLGNDLRMVILTDYIYPELLPTTRYDRASLSRIGVSTLFEQLRRDALPDDDWVLQLNAPVAPGQLAVLTGSLVIVASQVAAPLQHLANLAFPDEQVIRTRPLFPESDYVKIEASSKAAKHLVNWITQLFAEGHLKILIGTTALLGEGWDAPAINSLVLASTVGSFVLSNQIRGRAIRVDRQVPDKTANIWHPVAFNPSLPGGGADFQLLSRRFRAFPGLNLIGEPMIANGLKRYPFKWEIATADEVRNFAKVIRDSACHRNTLHDRWQTALANGRQVVEAIQPPPERDLFKEKQLKNYFWERIDYEQQGEIASFNRVGLRLSFASVLFTLFFLHDLTISLWMAGATGIAILLAGLGVTYKLRRLFRLRQQLAFSPSERPAVSRSILGFSVLNAGFLFLVNPQAPVFFLFLLVSGHWLFSLRWRSHRSASFLKRLSDRKKHFATYCKALLDSLIETGKLHRVQRTQLLIEDHVEAGLFAYLSQADHHDTHLFATSLFELLNQADNPRWLLRLHTPEGENKGAYYLPVPTELARRKTDAEVLQEQMRHTTGLDFDLIYTRTPAGRQHLLSARLLDLRPSQKRQAKRDVLWR